jgi:hypothetical protein
MVAKTQTMGGSVSEYHKSRGMTVCDPAPHQPRAIGHLLTRPVGRPPNGVRHSFTNFTHPTGTRMRPRRVAAKIEWLWGELYLCVGFMVTNTAKAGR